MGELDTRTALTIQDCMALVMGDVREVAKKDRNTQQNFPFRGVDAVVNAVAPALRKHGVVVLPRLEDIEREHVLSGAKQTPMLAVHLIVTYRFVGPGGDWLEAKVAGEAMDSGDKATAKAMSVAFRIALLQALALPTDDQDPDATTYERSATASPVAAAPGGSTAKANTGQGSSSQVTRDVDGAEATHVAAPPSHSGSDQETRATPASDQRTRTDGAPAGDASEVTIAYGEGVTDAPTVTPAGAPTYLSKDDQGLLAVQYASRVKALNAYQARFGSRITRLGDITYEMRDEMEGARA